MGDVEYSVGGVWRKYRTVKETHDEAMAWFWFASWPVTWEVMDRFVCVFCGVADCCEEDVVAVDCCEGDGLHSYKGIMILLLPVKGFQVERGNKNASNPDVSTTCCDIFASMDAFWSVISFFYGKGQFPRGLPHRICVPRLNVQS
eukprot:scaffold209651_cov46-Attheya_sp.AAC.1